MTNKRLLALTGVLVGLAYAGPTIASHIHSAAAEKTLEQMLDRAGRITNLTIYGASPAVSPAGSARFKYNASTNRLQLSENAGAYANVGGVGGSGTANKLAKFSAATTLADSLLSDDGTNVTLASGQFRADTIRGTAGTTGGLNLADSNQPFVTVGGTDRVRFLAGSFEPVAGQTVALGSASSTARFAGAYSTHFVVQGANGQDVTRARFEEAHTLAAAATSSTTNTIPANSRTVATSFRITTTITGCASVDAGVSGATTRFGTFSAMTANTTMVSQDTSAYAAATNVLFTCNGGTFSDGAIRVMPVWDAVTAPTS